MKIQSLFIGLLLLGVAAESQSACQTSDLYGTWLVKYRYNRPQQVGTCVYNFSPSTGLTGDCHNITYDLDFDFFDGGFNVKRNCKMTAAVVLTDGSINTATGTLRLNGTASGSLKARTYGKILTGTFSMVRTAR